MKNKLVLVYVWIILYLSSYQRRIVIAHILNSWKWPFRYFGKFYYKKQNYSKDKKVDTKYTFTRGIRKWLASNLSQYDELYYHNVTVGHMTPEQYSFWWECSHVIGTDEAIDMYYNKYPPTHSDDK